MSLEAKIEANTAAVTRLADLMEAGGAAAPKAAAAAKAAAPKAAAKTKITADQIKAAIVGVKDTVGADEARELIERHAGDGKKLADLILMPATFEAVMADCAAAMEGGGEEAAAEDDGL